jgi:hypothetical protein
MPRQRKRETDPMVRYRNMLEAQGLPAMAGLSRAAHLRRTPPSTATTGGGGAGGPMVIDMGDSIVYTGWSKRYYPIEAATLGAVRATVTTIGSSETQANVYIGTGDTPVLQGVVTILTGNLVSAPLAVNAVIPAGGWWQVLVGQAGTGSAGLTFYGAAT